MGMDTSQAAQNRPVDLRDLGQQFSHLRLVRPEAVRQMQHSLEQNGQLTPLSAWQAQGDRLEVVDGFKRLHAAQKLGWLTVWVRPIGYGSILQAKLAVALLNAGSGLNELEEAWLVQSLYRQDRLNQPQIGHLWGRSKSWVCRRLALAESLEESVVDDLRLGLLPARAAAEIARLPRDNQPAMAQVAMRRGMTCAQVCRLVNEVLKCPDVASIRRLLAQHEAISQDKGRPRPTSGRSPLEQVMADIGQLRRLCARLQGQIGQPALWLSTDAGDNLALDAITDVLPVLAALTHTLRRFIEGSARLSGSCSSRKDSDDEAQMDTPTGVGATGDPAQSQAGQPTEHCKVDGHQL
jgi:ParB-like chromosome segregation protein Spo0J